MNWFSKSIVDTEKLLKTNIKIGLTNTEVNKRMKEYGLNELPHKKEKKCVIILLKSLFEPLSLILILVGILTLIFSAIFIKKIEYIEPLIIFIIVIVNSTINTIQEIKARKSIDALKSIMLPIISVLRDGKVEEIPTKNLVIGDIVLLEAGKYIPADLKLFNCQRLMINESVLTGESVPVSKNINMLEDDNILLADQTNMAFMSTIVTNGRAEGIVVATGVDSAIGKIAQSIIKTENKKSPLQTKLQQLSNWISIFALLLAFSIFVILFLNDKQLWNSHLIIAITLAVAVIPESLTIIISIILSISVGKMVKKNVITKKLVAVEALGAINIICSDKTGTLTQNIMEIKKYFFNNQVYNDDATTNFNNEFTNFFIYSLLLCNDATINKKQKIGDPTEIALVDWANKHQFNVEKIRNNYLRIDEIPFDSERKLMSTVNIIEKQKIVFTKGAIDQLLENVSQINLNNEIIEMTIEMKKNILNINNKFSQDGLRVIAVAYKKFDNKSIESNLIFLGMVAMQDPVRPEAKRAISEAKGASIKTIMITGDHKITAFAIAKQLEIATSENQVLDGKELHKLNDKQLMTKIDDITVYARIDPHDKVRIVQCLQKQNNIVAMTGDGVNDAPCLNQADIGVAMGITGTDVAKQAADIIITDDNFKTIVTGVNEGRNIYQKILRSITFIFSANLAQVIIMFSIILIFKISPLNAINILWFNLIIETILAIPIALDTNDATLMYNKPRKKNQSIFRPIIIPILAITIILVITVILGFLINYYLFNDKIASSSAFMILINAPIFYVALIKLSNYRYKQIKKITINWILIIAMVVALIANSLIIFTPKINTIIFKLEPIPINAIFINYVLILVPSILILIFKVLIYLNYNFKIKNKINV